MVRDHNLTLHSNLPKKGTISQYSNKGCVNGIFNPHKSKICPNWDNGTSNP